MDIAALSVGLSQGKLQQQASLSVMKIAMDTAKAEGTMVTELSQSGVKALEQSVQPHLGRSIDTRI